MTSILIDNLRGPQGAPGATGPPGAQGAAGVAGVAGAQGVQGPQGNPGSDANVLLAAILSPGSSARNVIQPTAAGFIPLVIKGFAAQSANLQEWQDSSGGLVSSIGADGKQRAYRPGVPSQYVEMYHNGDGVMNSPTSWVLQVGGTEVLRFLTATTARLGAAIIPAGPSFVPFVVRGAASQTANLQEWQNSAGTVVAYVYPSGSIVTAGDLVTTTGIINTPGYNVTMSLNNAVFVGADSTNTVKGIVRGIAGQSVDIFQVQDSAAAKLMGISLAGLLSWIAGNEQTTVGAAGAASALPATPTKFLKVVDSTGATLVIPAYAAA